MISHDDVYRIGRIGKSHGVSGEVDMHFDDDVFDRVEADYVVLEIDGILVPFFFEEYRFRNDATAIVKFEGVDSEQRARELTHAEVFFPRNLADEAGDNPSLAMLVGYRLIDEVSQKEVGKIKSVDDTTINILFEVTNAEGTDILIPAADELIKEINTRERLIIMNIPQGLI